MRILMLSSDRAVFDSDSSVRARITEQGSLVTKLHVIVFTGKDEKFSPFHIGKHVTVHPTRSSSKFAYIVDAYRLGVDIIKSGRKNKNNRKTSFSRHSLGGERADTSTSLTRLGNKDWLVTSQDPFELGAVAYMLARKFRTPLHLQLHTDPWAKAWRNGNFLNRIRFVLALFLLRRADGVRVVSERIKRNVLALQIPNERVTKAPIYVDVKHFLEATPAFDLHRSYSEFSRIVLSLGRLQPEKNYHGLIRAFARVHKEHDGSLLLIVGNGPERERLLFLARSLGLLDCVKILPWARDVATYYKTCDVYVQPSIYEGWGLAVTEAMASGAPVVMTDVGCAGEVVKNEETGLVVPVGDEEALAYAIGRLLTDHELALHLATNGLAEVKKLATKAETLLLYKMSWEKAVKQSVVSSQ